MNQAMNQVCHDRGSGGWESCPRPANTGDAQACPDEGRIPADSRRRLTGSGGGASRRTRWRTVAPWCLAAVVSLPLPATGAGAEVRPANAESFPEGLVVGRTGVYVARYEDTLLDVARRFGMGIEEIRLANPGVDLWLPGEGTAIRLPSRFVLPEAPRRGLVINVPEMRIYYYPNDGSAVHTWPISIGRVGQETPLGKTSIVRKMAGPTWFPTDSIRKEYAERGEKLPRAIGPGPDNPLGSHALYLGFPTYLIHGTNRPYSIGMRVSHGCVRMYPEDIVELYEMAEPGMPVTLVHQEVKAGWAGDELYIEVHPNVDVPDEDARPGMIEAVKALAAAAPEGEVRLSIDWKRVRETVAAANGVPVAVGNRATGAVTARMESGDDRPLR